MGMAVHRNNKTWETWLNVCTSNEETFGWTATSGFAMLFRRAGSRVGHSPLSVSTAPYAARICAAVCETTCTGERIAWRNWGTNKKGDREIWRETRIREREGDKERDGGDNIYDYGYYLKTFNHLISCHIVLVYNMLRYVTICYSVTLRHLPPLWFGPLKQHRIQTISLLFALWLEHPISSIMLYNMISIIW